MVIVVKLVGEAGLLVTTGAAGAIVSFVKANPTEGGELLPRVSTLRL